MAMRLNYNKWDSPYIYHIIAGDKIYVGQSADTNSIRRMYAHFYAAYYKEKGSSNTDSERKIHDEMQKHRIQEVQVRVYDKSNNFGILNFDELADAFLQEWEPIAENKKMNAIKLDLAEIFHIQWALQQQKYQLTNTQMGGKASGWAIKGSLKDVEPDQRRKKKVLLKTFKPDAAAIVFTTDADDLQTINDAMRFLFDKAFDDDWEQYCQTLGIRLDDSNKKSWSEYFKNDILPELTKVYTEDLKEKLYSELQSEKNQAKDSLHKHMSAFIKQGFINPREKVFRQIFKKVAPDKSWGLNFQIVMEGLSWFQLSSYIAKAVSNPISAIMSKATFKRGKNQNKLKSDIVKANLTNFKPANFLASYDISKLNGKSSTRGQWLQNINITETANGIEDWKRHFSLLLFNHLCEEALITNPLTTMREPSAWTPDLYGPYSFNPLAFPYDNNMTVNRNYSRRNPELNTIHMSWMVPHSEWLSTRVHTLYKLYAPGYDGIWWEFYRPMVALWRSKRNSPEFIIEQDPDNSEYKTEYWVGNSSRIEYRMGSTAVFEVKENLDFY